MKIKYKILISILCIFFYSCRDYDYYTLSSPDNSKCVTLEYSIPVNPSDSTFVKLFIGTPPVDDQQYVKMLWSNIGAVDIDWNSSPLKVRSWLIRENTFSEKLVDAKLKMTALE